MSKEYSDYLDPDFGDHGVIEVGLLNNTFGQLAPQSDGSFLIIGEFRRDPLGVKETFGAPDKKIFWKGMSYGRARVKTPMTQGLMTAKLTPEGMLDGSYGTNGYAYSPDLRFGVDIESFVILPDNSAIVAYSLDEYGTTYSRTVHFRKIKSDGMWDVDFGKDGVYHPELKYSCGDVPGMSVTRDGKILITATNYDTYFSDFSERTSVLMQITPEGAPDLSFASKGFAYAPAGREFDRISVGPNGEIYLSGRLRKKDDTADLAVFCYSQSGTIVNDFGEEGMFTYAADQQSESSGLAALQDGVYVGAHTGLDRQYAIYTKLTSKGMLDSGFNGGEPLKVTLGAGNVCHEIFPLASGGIITTGSCSGANAAFTLTLIQSDGTLDTTFGDNGSVLTPVVGFLLYSFAKPVSDEQKGEDGLRKELLVKEPLDTKLLVAGRTLQRRPGELTSFWIARYRLGRI